MQLLVFAHMPPPVHGQSLMVQTLLEGLPPVAPEIELHHVNPQLSTRAADIGRWRFGKLLPLLRACRAARRLRRQHGPMTFYYVPAPGKRSALWRDLLVMLLCRPHFPTLVLHWHAVGLGAWLNTEASSIERWLAQRLLGRADLSIVLATELAADARLLAPRRIAIVPNGIGDPLAEAGSRSSETGTEIIHRRDSRATSQTECPEPGAQNHFVTEVLFLGLGSRDKGLFDTLSAIALANQRTPGAFRLTVAGGFASAADETAFRSQAATLGPGVVRHVGFADTAKKWALFGAADVFCFPTSYAHEGQPLVLIEALAHDRPIITTRWRAIPSMLPREHVWIVDRGRPDQLAAALLAAREADPPHGQLRAHYLAHFTRAHHLAALREALAPLTKPEDHAAR